MKKIAVFGIKTYPAFAGADRVVENILHNLDGHKGDYHFFVYLVKGRERLADLPNRHFIYIPAFKGKHLHAFSFFFLCTLHMLFVRRYDLIHAHKSDTGFFTLLLCLRYAGKILGTFHGDPYKDAKWGAFAKRSLKVSEHLFIRSCSKLTSVSPVKTVAGRRVLFVPNGLEQIDPGLFRSYKNKSINYRALALGKKQYLLFAAGRLDKIKGLHHLIDAYEKGYIREPLLIISDFSHDRVYGEAMERRIRNLKHPGIVLIKKLLPKNDLFDVMMNAQMVVCPSEIEAMSMIVLEVLACSTLLVCSDIESNKVILGTDYKYLFRSKDADSLLAAVQAASADWKRGQIQEFLQKRFEIQQRFDWKKIAETYLQIYDALFARSAHKTKSRNSECAPVMVDGQRSKAFEF